MDAEKAKKYVTAASLVLSVCTRVYPWFLNFCYSAARRFPSVCNCPRTEPS